MIEYSVQPSAPSAPENRALRTWAILCLLIAVAIFSGCFLLFEKGCEWPVLLTLPALAAVWISYKGGL